MQFKTVRHRDQDGKYHNGSTVQCLRRVREVTPDFPEGKNVQRVVAKFDRAARELPAEVAAILTPAELEEWKDWRVKQDEELLKSSAQYELDTLAERMRIIRTGIQKGYAATDTQNAVAIRTGARSLSDLLQNPGRYSSPKPDLHIFWALLGLSAPRIHRFEPVFPVFQALWTEFGRNTAMRFKFHAMHTSVHSLRTLARPRSRNCRNFMTDLMMPNTGSTVCLRSA